MSGIAAKKERVSKAVLGILFLSFLGLAISGCGRRGAPELPPSASVIVTDEDGNTVEKPAAEVDRPFILDPLIQ